MEDLLNNENSNPDNKQYTNLSTVNIEKHLILDSHQQYGDSDYQNKYTILNKVSTNQENIPPFYPEDFLLASSYVKKYYTRDTELDSLKTKQVVESFRDESMSIEVDFDSENDSKLNEIKDINSNENIPTDITKECVNKLDSNEKEHKSWISGLELNLKPWEKEREDWEKNKEDFKCDEKIKSEEKPSIANAVTNNNVNRTDSPDDKNGNTNDDIKTETLGEENMITILVPQDMDVKNIKLEPEDPGYEQFACLDDEEIYDVDDNEDFYIIQVQDSLDGNNKNNFKAKKRDPSKCFGSPQLAKCELCEYQTYDKSNLRKHKLIHTDLKPYTCEFCSFTCKLPKYLKQHMVTHMTVRLFPCVVCCHRCRNLTELNRHIKRHLRLNKKSSVEELTEQERSYCVCRDGCKTDSHFKRMKRERKI